VKGKEEIGKRLERGKKRRKGRERALKN